MKSPDFHSGFRPPCSATMLALIQKVAHSCKPQAAAQSAVPLDSASATLLLSENPEALLRRLHAEKSAGTSTFIVHESVEHFVASQLPGGFKSPADFHNFLTGKGGYNFKLIFKVGSWENPSSFCAYYFPKIGRAR